MRSERVLPFMAIVVVAVAMTGCQQLRAVLGSRPSAHMPVYKPVDVQFANQNWTADQRAWFYHSAQGTELLPYKWFMALQQPQIKVFGDVPKFADSAYLARFGFLPDSAGPQNPEGLPVGF